MINGDISYILALFFIACIVVAFFRYLDVDNSIKKKKAINWLISEYNSGATYSGIHVVKGHRCIRKHYGLDCSTNYDGKGCRNMYVYMCINCQRIFDTNDIPSLVDCDVEF